MVALARLEQWQYQLAWQHGWGKCHGAKFPDEQVQTANDCQEWLISLPQGGAPNWLSNTKWLSLNSYTYKQH